MNKEEILARSRLENQNGDERELDAYTQGWKHAAKIGLLMCAVLMILEVFWGDSKRKLCRRRRKNGSGAEKNRKTVPDHCKFSKTV